jgi:hypothetical protein
MTYAPIQGKCPACHQDSANTSFQAGAASRDAEIQRLQFALADAESLELGTAERCDQLRAQINVLQDLLKSYRETVLFRVGSSSTYRVVAQEFQDRIKSTLASAPEQSLAEYRNKVIEECAKRAEAYAYMSQNFNALAEELRAMKEQP